MSTSTKNYESEWDCNPFAKLAVIPLVIGFALGPIVVFFQNDTWSEKYPYACAVSIGGLSVALQVRMSMLRCEMNYLESEKLIGNTDRFKRWSLAQMNHAEYAPHFIAGLLFREYLRASMEKPLSSLGSAVCTMSLIGNFGFVAITFLYPFARVVENSNFEKLLRKLGFTKFWRMMLVTARYMSLGLLWLDLALEAA